MTSTSLSFPFPTVDLVAIPGLVDRAGSSLALVAPAAPLLGSMLPFLEARPAPAGCFCCLSILASTSSSNLLRSHLSSSAPFSFAFSRRGSPAVAVVEGPPPTRIRLLAGSTEVEGE